MSRTVVIEEYKPGYQSQVVDMILFIQQAEYQIPITREDQPDLYDIEGIYQTGRGNFWVALSEGEVIGTVALLDIGNRRVALRKMFVKREYRGKQWKASAGLLQTAIDGAREQGALEIYLGTTLQFEAAHRFYEKNGFVSINSEELPPGFPVMQVDKKFYKYGL